tara:strand:- start:1110 stop:1616 length:507 start_codon:yes stop_codon:yes gene_type:complete
MLVTLKADNQQLKLDLEARDAEISNLNTQLAEFKASNQWYNLDQMVLLPETSQFSDPKIVREFQTQDGNKAVSMKVNFLSSKDSLPGSRQTEIVFINNGFGDLRNEVFNRIEAGNRICIVRARHTSNEWESPEGETVVFDKFRAISVKDVPVSKYNKPVEATPELATA